MKPILDGKFYNPTKGNLSFEEVTHEIVDWMKENPQKEYEVVVGCDSSSDESPHFPVAIVVLRKGQGGRFFLRKVKYKDKRFHTWRERVLEEVVLSCDLALSLKKDLEGQVNQQFLDFQLRYIHADIGPRGDTKDMIKEVTGLIRGNGFEPKIKPEAYVASTVADRFV